MLQEATTCGALLSAASKINSDFGYLLCFVTLTAILDLALSSAENHHNSWYGGVDSFNSASYAYMVDCDSCGDNLRAFIVDKSIRLVL